MLGLGSCMPTLMLIQSLQRRTRLLISRLHFLKLFFLLFDLVTEMKVDRNMSGIGSGPKRERHPGKGLSKVRKTLFSYSP